MALFRRRRSTQSDSAVAVDAFWRQWPEFRAHLAALAESGTRLPEDVAARLNEAVRRIHPDVTWRVGAAPQASGGGPGDTGDLDIDEDSDPGRLLERLAALDDPLASLENAGDFALTLSAGSDDQARVLTERWARAAPQEPGWRFFPAFPRDHDRLGKTLGWEGHELDLAHCTVAMRVDQQSSRMEIGVYHPDFMFLADDLRGGVSERVVILALGEDDYVRWISKVEPLVEKPLDPLPPASMPSVVEQLANTMGSGGWVTLQGRVPLRGIIEIAVRHPLHRRDFPALTLYVHVALAYTNSDSDRLPAEPSATALAEFAEGLRTLLGDNGALLAQQTSSGQRQFYFYLDPDSGVLNDFEAAVRMWSEGQPTLQSRLDPEWQTIDQLMRPIRRQLGG
ncbi:DUF695 domain-containing protein [Streptomonospora wellingtoniae]|uniref:DUF695 domain-containing protein n=1 Tax=Streptomonospora wellingtoniae TaxID=3075544 RepID=A0ABU2KSW9_9ACTN|nr:DUF695 domain-containing protein [Streptomonospora sp. DSM 45055]MDT0302391.1 DUF695 domain-containing protein [Streptomonospora sp. DSM 45055]